MQDVTIVFDLDGTLVDTAPDLVDATNHALASLKLGAIEESELRRWISFGARRMIVQALELNKREQNNAEIDALHETFLEYYEANIAKRSAPYPGVLKALNELKDRGAKLAICTNKRENLARQLMDELELAHHFSAIAGRDTFPVHKPDPEHLWGAIRLANGDKNRAVMIGDSATDTSTAKIAGIPCIAVTFGYTAIPAEELGADIVIGHYDGLLSALGGLGFS